MLRWLRDKLARDRVTVRDRREKERRDRKILCPRCGYDVKDLPDQPCPECGLQIDSRWTQGRLGAGSSRRMNMLGGGLLMTWAVFLYALAIVFALGLAMRGLPRPVPTTFWVIMFVAGAVCAVGASLFAAGFRFRRRILYGPPRLCILYYAAAVVLFAITFAVGIAWGFMAGHPD